MITRSDIKRLTAEERNELREILDEWADDDARATAEPPDKRDLPTSPYDTLDEARGRN